MRFLKQLPVQLILCFIAAFALEPYLSAPSVAAFYTLSCIIKDLLMVILPVVIFSYIVGAILSMEQKAPLLLICILGLVTLSNAFSVFVSLGVGTLLLPSLIGSLPMALVNVPEPIHALFSLPGLQLIGPEKAMLAGISCGVLIQIAKNPPMITAAFLKLRDGVNIVLRYGFIPVLPVYVFGFVIKLHYEGSLSLLIQHYAQVVGLSVVLCALYILALYLLGAGFKLPKALMALKNMSSASITGFCTMSSAATMPLTLEATEKNLKNPNFADLIIPTTANIHRLGDNLSVPLMILSLLLMHHSPLPSVTSYALFIFYFCLAQFSTAGIPGGGIIVLLPIMETYLGFSPDMLSLITTIYILQDPFLTSANVTGNGGFALVSERLVKRLLPSSPALSATYPVTTEMIKDLHPDMHKIG